MTLDCNCVVVSIVLSLRTRTQFVSRLENVKHMENRKQHALSFVGYAAFIGWQAFDSVLNTLYDCL